VGTFLQFRAPASFSLGFRSYRASGLRVDTELTSGALVSQRNAGQAAQSPPGGRGNGAWLVGVATIREPCGEPWLGSLFGLAR